MIQSRIRKAFTLQQGQSDCGVACLSTILKYHNGSTTIERIRELSGTSKQGTTLLGLYHAAEQLGFDAQGLEAESVENLKELAEPAILHIIQHANLQHYYVFFGFENDKIIIGDPGKGIITVTKNELEQEWKSKALLKLVPNENFIKVKKKKKEKWDWFRSLIAEDFNILLIALFLGIVISIIGLSRLSFHKN